MKPKTILKSNGQATVEFALVIIVLLMILMGIFDLGRIVYTSAALSNAAREGARVAVVNNSLSTVQQTVISKGIGLGIQSPPTTIGMTYYLEDGVTITTDRGQASTVKVTISNYPFVAITPLVGVVFGPSNTINLSSSASMMIENPTP